MKERNIKILILATSRKTRGGITSVIKAHESGEQWAKYHCRWIETHIDKGMLYKLYFFLKSFLLYLFTLPFYDLIHVHISEPPSAIRKFTFILYAKLFQKKIIIHFHSFSPETTINSSYKQLYNFIFSNSDCVLVLSEYWKKEIISTFGLSDKITVLYNPCIEVDHNAIHEKQNSILYAGTLSTRKGYQDLIAAFSKLAFKYPDWKLHFAGNGDIESAKNISNHLNINDQIFFPGWISGSDKAKYFQEASIFCLPSYAEGFPMAVLDAWAYGLPVVTTPVGGLPDVLQNGKNALVFNPGDINSLANMLEQLMKDEVFRKKISIESSELAKAVFNRDVICINLSKIYYNLFTSDYKI